MVTGDPCFWKMQMATWILKVGILTEWGNEMFLYSSVMMPVGYRRHKNGDLIPSYLYLAGHTYFFLRKTE